MERNVSRILFMSFVLFVMGIFALPMSASAGKLSYVSDTITDSAPGSTSTTHVIQFTASTTIPQGGTIYVYFEPRIATYDIPIGLDYTDVDLSVAASSTAPFVARNLAPIPSISDEGVTVIPGTSPSITVTLGSGGASPIPAGALVRLTVGPGAVVGGAGDVAVTNPSIVGSYHVRLRTTDATFSELDDASTLIAVVLPVSMGPVDTTDSVPPIISNGLPSGLLPGNTAQVFVSFNTDKLAVCRYDTASGTPYASMLASTTFTSANLGLLHYTTATVASSTIYNYFIRCANNSNVPTTADYLISFEVGVMPGTTTPPAPPAPPPVPPGGPSGSGGPGGPGGPFLFGGDVTIEGQGAPGSTLVILKDGAIEKELPISVLGTFSERFSGLPRGTYAWSLYHRDASGSRSTTYTSTIYLVSQTNNMITPVYLSPTIRASSSVAIGAPLAVSGSAIALTPVQVLMNKQGNVVTGRIITGSTTSNGNGTWTVTLPTTGLDRGTYEVKAVSVLAGGKDRSLISPIVYVGVGESAQPNLGNRSDLNRDTKVNLVDFSILLFNWRGTDPVSDINQDGVVNLTDFSIMLSNWTG
jgi:hypothetical protein